MLNALTVDVEDYFHVASFEGVVSRRQWGGMEQRVMVGAQRLLEAFAHAGVRGTFFVLGWVAEHAPGLVREIRDAGHEVGCHSYWHRLVYRQTPDQFRDDLRRARDVLQDAIGEPVVAYRAPCFSITRQSLWALDVLIEEGFQYDSSIFPTYHDRYGIAGAPLAPHRIVRAAGAIREFPLAVHQVFGYPLPLGGGGYFRLYPFAVTRWGMRAINAQGRPVAFYLHPWELDSGQPRLPLGGLNAFRHYVNLRWTEARLRRLLNEFAFGTLSEAYARAQGEEEDARWDLRQVA
ncbi:MAG: DUF3473 domain-containing protein [Planctomycetia bacterium]|nr:DUF3473 domain-containing protein [Planctomycetia bacterium]